MSTGSWGIWASSHLAQCLQARVLKDNVRIGRFSLKVSSGTSSIVIFPLTTLVDGHGDTAIDSIVDQLLNHLKHLMPKEKMRALCRLYGGLKHEDAEFLCGLERSALSMFSLPITQPFQGPFLAASGEYSRRRHHTATLTAFQARIQPCPFRQLDHPLRLLRLPPRKSFTLSRRCMDTMLNANSEQMILHSSRSEALM
jgi:hypothetical protein